MQYRLDTRTRINMDVELRLNGSRLGRFQTRDIDSMGAFIEAEGIDLQLHDVIDIDFLLDRHGIYSQKGSVVRCAGDGIAVMFMAENSALCEALGEWLFDRYPPAYGTLAS